MKLFVSTGNSRMEKRWNGAELEAFVRRISHTIRTSETVEQYRKLSKAKQDDIKDVGGFVLGKLKGGRRKKDCVVFRSALTLDMDYASLDIPEQIEMFFDFRCLIYSTHKQTVIASHFGTESYYIGTYYKTYGAKDRKGREWKATFDSSITAQKKERGRIIPAGEEYKCEIVSPILTYDDIPDLQEIIRQLRHRKAMVNEKCGIHIHVDASLFTPQTLRNIVNIMASKEDILYKALRIDPDRLWYCKKVNEELITTINQKKPKTMEQLKDIRYAQEPGSGRDQHYNRTRYHGLNLHATFTKGTVEFRIFNSTLHAGEVKAYIQFCLAVTHQALVQKKASSRRTETDNEKYAFRCWMLRLGLIGDEFKTCRLHFLKNLEGNSAWRHGV